MGDSLAVQFIANYWKQVLGATLPLLVLYLIQCFFSKRQDNHDTPSQLPEEHPLAEFRDSRPSEEDELLAPPIHSEATEHIPYVHISRTEGEMIQRSQDFYQLMNSRRSVRMFSRQPVPIEVIKNIIHTAGTSPSGAHSEPWTFVAVQDPKIKSKIREIIEREEYVNYDRRMGDKWVQELKFINTDHEKPYLEEAPYLIIVFKQPHRVTSDGKKHAHYYYEISTAISTGILIAAIQNAGLVSVTTTPMNAGGAIRELLGRPEHEKVMLVLPVGYPADNATVPGVARKPLDDIMVVI